MENTFPEVIYHYTSAQALEKIIKNGQIWATNYRYLNDSQEIGYGYDSPFNAGGGARCPGEKPLL
jgi:hypothetical protein